MAWHDATCATLDLEWEDGQPGCRKCERKAPKLAPVHPISPPAPPPDTPRSELICTWPPSLFSQAQGADDEDSDTLARILANIDEWTGTTSTRPSQRELKSDQQTPQQQPLDRSEPDLLFQGIYSRLPNADSIRLLRLHGSEDTNDSICGTLEIYRLHEPDRPIFEALSYTWADSQGDSSLCEAIFVGAHFDILPITRNCQAALRRLRVAADRLVWVDSICINQFDSKERGHLVSLMMDICSSAARVVTYLGDRHDLSATIARPSNSGDQHSGPSSIDMRAVLRMPYFSRIWVIQELVLSKTASLTFDEHTIHWQDFSSQAKTLSKNKEHGSYVNWVGRLSKKRKIRGLMSALQATEDCQCSDPRDRVYGLMGLADAFDQKTFSIDYSISVQQLYTGLTMHWLTEPGGMFSSGYILYRAFFPKDIPFLPSWVPDWNVAPKTKANLTPISQIQLHDFGMDELSPGLDWFEALSLVKSSGTNYGWSLDDNFWHRLCLRNQQEIVPNKLWRRNAMEAGWNPESLARPLRVGGMLALDAAHILSISNGEVILTDINGRILHGLHIAGLDEGNLEKSSLEADETHLYVLLNWQRSLLLRRHGDNIYSLHSPCRITYVPKFPLADFQFHQKLEDISVYLGSLETRIVEGWLANLCFLRIRAGAAFATSPLRTITQRRWVRRLPKASAACIGAGSPLDRYADREHERLALRTMIDLQNDVVDFVKENKVYGFYNRSRGNKPTSSQDKVLFQSLLDLSSNPLLKVDLDTELAVRFKRADEAWFWRTSSIEKIISLLKGVVDAQRETCKKHLPLETALSDLQDTWIQPRIAVRLPTDNLGNQTLPCEDSPVVYELMSSILFGEVLPLWSSSVFLDEGRIIQRAWSLLDRLVIDAKYTLQENFSILWIHVSTMEMVARLRSVLQKRLIFKAIGDNLGNVQSIYLI